MESSIESDSPVRLAETEKKDVVVIGGGPAGIAAALSARRNGADVLLIEKESYLGGNMTGGFVYVINGYRSNDEDAHLLVKGIGLEVFRKLLEAGGTHPGETDEDGRPLPVREDHGQFHDPTVLVHVLDAMMEESNVDVLFNTYVFDVLVDEDGDEIEGVLIANKSGGQIVRADLVIDCSGDADVAAAAGAPFEQGREEDGRYRGISKLMAVGGIDVERLLDYLQKEPEIPREELEKLDEERSRLLGGGGPPGAVQTIDGETKHGVISSREPRDWDLIEEQMERGEPLTFRIRGGPTGMGVAYEHEGEMPPEVKYNYEWIDYIKSGNVPPMPGAKKQIFPPPPSLGVLGFGMYLHGKRRYDTMLSGVYETWFDQIDAEGINNAIMFGRRLNWIYIQFLRERIPGFEDAYIMTESPKIGKRDSRRIIGEYILTDEDTSTGRRFPDGIAKGNRSAGSHSVTGIWGTFVSGEYEPFEIPYRSLVPKEIDNLLVAGRCISASFFANSGIRNMAPCMATGEAAGAAAALCSRLDTPPRELDHQLLQKRLVDQGALLTLDHEEPKEAEVTDVRPLEDRLA